MEQEILLLLGTNQGDKRLNLKNAIDAIELLPSSIKRTSSIYKTAAWGATDQPDFFNQAMMITSSLAPELLMTRILEIEQHLGRKRSMKWEPRIIDIDILFVGNQIIQIQSLTVPHPLLHKRRFALLPLMEIAPDFFHPIFRKDIKTLLSECSDMLPVEKIDF